VLHRTGKPIPAVGLGTWQIQPKEAPSVIRQAILAGYRHIDCSPGYGNEVVVGQAIQASIKDGLVTREELFIASKLPNTHNAPDKVQPALQKTLQDLQLAYLDLYLIHWPVCVKEGHTWPPKPKQYVSLNLCNMSSVYKELERALEKGLVKHIGVSNFSPTKLQQLKANIPPDVNQVESHPYLQQPKLHEYCREHKIHITAYSSLGSPARPGLLRETDEPNLLQDPAVLQLAQTRNATPAQVLLSWGRAQGHSVLVKSSNPTRLRQNLVAIDLSPAELQQLAALDQGYRYFNGIFWTSRGSPWTLKTIWDE
jgi:alcohol dehydrogenase (NADP+)